MQMEEKEDPTSEERKRPPYAMFFGNGAQSPDNFISGFAKSSYMDSIADGRHQRLLGTIGPNNGEVSPLGSDFKVHLDFRSPTQTEGPSRGNLMFNDVRAGSAYPLDDDQVEMLQSPPTVAHTGEDVARGAQPRIKLKKTSPSIWADIQRKMSQY
jgi:hypothetical protein